MDTRDHNEYEMVLKKLKEFRSPSSFKIFQPMGDVIDWNTISRNTIPAFSRLAVFFWIHYACCGRAHRIGKKGISVSRFAQPAWLIFIGPPVFQVSKGLHPILLGKIWPSVYDDKRCSYNDEKWVDAMKNGMWDKLIEPQFAGSWRKVSWYLRRLRHGCTTQRYPGGRVVTHQLWNGKNSSWLPFRNSTLENRLLPCMLETCI